MQLDHEYADALTTLYRTNETIGIVTAAQRAAIMTSGFQIASSAGHKIPRDVERDLRSAIDMFGQTVLHSLNVLGFVVCSFVYHERLGAVPVVMDQTHLRILFKPSPLGVNDYIVMLRDDASRMSLLEPGRITEFLTSAGASQTPWGHVPPTETPLDNVWIFEQNAPDAAGRVNSRVSKLRDDAAQMEQIRTSDMHAIKNAAVPPVVEESTITKDSVLPDTDLPPMSALDETVIMRQAQMYADSLSTRGHMDPQTKRQVAAALGRAQSVYKSRGNLGDISELRIGPSTMDADAMAKLIRADNGRKVTVKESQQPKNYSDYVAAFEERVFAIFGLPRSAVMSTGVRPGIGTTNADMDSLPGHMFTLAKRHLQDLVADITNHMLDAVYSEPFEKTAGSKKRKRDSRDRFTIEFFRSLPSERLLEVFQMGGITANGFCAMLCSTYGINPAHLDPKKADMYRELANNPPQPTV